MAQQEVEQARLADEEKPGQMDEIFVPAGFRNIPNTPHVSVLRCRGQRPREKQRLT
ncbi:MAG TPA: hypothetical protein VJ572_04705 [Azonexus sp.]|nr:hypothetical protein [Azonexus sp.]